MKSDSLPGLALRRSGIAIVVFAMVMASCVTGATPASASATGSVKAWGNNTYGELGNGKSVTSRNAPVQVSGLHRVAAVAAGGSHGLALLRNGTVMGGETTPPARSATERTATRKRPYL